MQLDNRLEAAAPGIIYFGVDQTRNFYNASKGTQLAALSRLTAPSDTSVKYFGRLFEQVAWITVAYTFWHATVPFLSYAIRR